MITNWLVNQVNKMYRITKQKIMKLGLRVKLSVLNFRGAKF